MSIGKTPIDQLIEGSRVKGESRMIPDGAKAESITREQAQDVINATLGYITSAGTSRSAIAKAINVAASTLGCVLSWKYPGNWQEIILDLDRWLEEQHKRDAAPRPTTFVWTKVAEEIRTVADIASTLKTIGLVYGPTTSGMGKTMAMEAIHAEKPGSILITIEKASSTYAGLLATIAKALRICDEGSKRHLYGKIKEKLAGTPRLLMIDQIHSLCGRKDDLPLFVLADLFDATSAPQLWCGTTDIIEYLDQGRARGKETLAQIRSRIGIQRDLLERTRVDGGPGEPLFTVDEIRRIFAKGKMRLAPEAAHYLCRLANIADSGALRTCKHLVILATAANERTGATILTADHLKATHRSLVSRRLFNQLEAQQTVKDHEMKMAKAG